MQQNRVNQKPRHPNSSPVGPDVNDKKIYTNSEGKRKRTQKQKKIYFARKAPLHKRYSFFIRSEVSPSNQKQIGRRPCNNISYNPHNDRWCMKNQTC